MLRVPGIASHAAKPRFSHGELAQRGLGNQDRARLLQSFDHSGVRIEDLVGVRRRAPGRADVFDRE